MKKSRLIFPFFAFVFGSLHYCLAQTPQLFGMTYDGGDHACGTVFIMNGDGSGFQTVYSFDTITGRNPYGTLLQADDGKLYGMAIQGGANGYGVLFRFDPANYTYNDLFDFNYSNGAFPYGSLIEATNGKLYGMTSSGGINNDGVLFSFDPLAESYNKLVDLNDSIGAIPKGDLMQASNGKLYGLTAGGGTYFYGVLFSFDLAVSKYSKLIDFNFTNGKSPYGSLVETPNGKLYGTTREGGLDSAGVLFSFDPATSSYSKLLEFAGGDTKTPCAGVMLANDGKFYGMNLQGGSDNVGEIYSFGTLGNIYNDVQDFDTTNGSSPSFNTLMQASNNKLYGMTVFGGTSNYGVVYSYDPAGNTFTKLVDFNGTNGKYPNGTLLELKTTTGIVKEAENSFLAVYPNPAGNKLRISLPVGDRIESIEIYNSLGEVLIHSSITRQSELDISSLSSGIYFVKAVDESGCWQNVGRFVKE